MRQITKVYDNGVAANRNVDFSLRAGEIHALVGENGAGKSTLMKILFGMERPSSGKIFRSGKALDMRSSKDAIANGIGMVHQHFMLVDSFTAAQNIILGIEPRRGFLVSLDKAAEFALKLSEKYNLPIDPTALVGGLTAGARQKIEILKALARGADILILDEPTAVLTPQETDRLFGELKALSMAGHTIVFISHKIREVMAVSDRITIMRGGARAGVFDTDSVSEQEIANIIMGREAGSETSPHLFAPLRSAGKGKVKIKVRDLTLKGRGGEPMLSSVSFDVCGGEILGVVGVQGSGQTPLVEALTGRRFPDRGSVFINGRDVSKLSMRQIRDSGCGFIPEDRLRQGVAVDADIRENMISGEYAKPHLCKLGVLRQRSISEFTEKHVAEYEITCGGGSTKVSTLSGGNIQKVVAAREFGAATEVLIAEQPTRGVDIGSAKVIHEKILALRANDCAVLLVSADLSEVMRLCDKLIVMYGGKIAAYYDETSAVTEEKLGLCMLGLETHSHEQIARAYNDRQMV